MHPYSCRPTTLLSLSSFIVELLRFLLLVVCPVSWLQPDFSYAWSERIGVHHGSQARIMVVHVSDAWLALSLVLALSLGRVLSWASMRPLYLMAGRSFSTIGCWATLMVLVTGVVWGAMDWGSCWVWDARLTSVLLLLLVLMGAFWCEKRDVDLVGVLLLSGFVDLPWVKSSVYWWNNLHQASSSSRFGTALDGPAVLDLWCNVDCSTCGACLAVLLELRLLILHLE